MIYLGYCDGATSNNGNINAVGGSAYIILDSDENIICKDSKHIVNSTNNIAELTAAIDCASKLSQILKSDDSAIIYCDSAYVVNCYKAQWYKTWVKNGWRTSSKTPVKNRTLWQKLIPFFENSQYTFQKVQGHHDNKWNNEVDRLAVEAKGAEI